MQKWQICYSIKIIDGKDHMIVLESYKQVLGGNITVLSHAIKKIPFHVVKNFSILFHFYSAFKDGDCLKAALQKYRDIK